MRLAISFFPPPSRCRALRCNLLRIGMAMGPDPRWAFLPLRETIGVFLLPVGMLLGKNTSPSGEAGAPPFRRSPFLIGDLEYSF
jgi:hypothetical protein